MSVLGAERLLDTAPITARLCFWLVSGHHDKRASN
jgi:hypothetical protein